MSIQNIIPLLETIKSQIDELDKHDLKARTLTISSSMERVFNKNSPYFAKLESVQKELNMLIALGDHKSHFGYTITNTRANFHRLLDAVLIELKALGYPETKSSKTDNSINISNVLSQEQNQSQNLEIIISSLKDHLTGIQYKELKEIAEKEKDPEKAKKSIIEKLKEFGENVCSNILANVITNPTIWSGLFG